jgi:signal transduction histidine kinase/ABC-type multidrug transport system ATPase subunit
MAATQAQAMSLPARAGPGLQVDRLTRRFGRLAAVQDVTLGVRPGEVVAVVGENGAGKTTLVRCIAGDLTPDEGRILVDGELRQPRSSGRRTSQLRHRSPPRDDRLEVVWQDLGLCVDLDIVANVFLGRELGLGLLAERRMHDAAADAFQRLGARLPDLRTEVAALSRGQRQEVALARALIGDPAVLVLDEPTASLSVSRRTRVVATLRRLRAGGKAILLVTHDLDEAFALADRIVVLRRGKVVAIVSPAEAHPDDVGALMSGVETESVARRQLDRLRSLVEQLSAAGPTASLPLVVSATALALDQDLLCVHLLAADGREQVLRRGAAVGLPPELLRAVETLHLDARGATIGEAAHRAELVVCEDVEEDPRWDPYRAAITRAGVRSVWAAPIVGRGGVLGTIAGFGTAVGRPTGDRVELLSLYAGHAAAAIEREQLFVEATRRNRVLESLRGLLESLAGPERVEGGLGVALLALGRGLRAGAVGLLVLAGDDEPYWTSVVLDDQADEELRRHADPAHLAGRTARLAPGVAGVRLVLPDGDAALVARFGDPDQPDADARELLDDAARSLALAIQREAVERAQQEAGAARRSQALQRDLLQRLSHELRTPLTAIHGYASTLQQPDLTWDASSTDRFLAAIAKESARMERLVGDLLDSSAIESGLLRLRRDWTDLPLVLEAARSCVRDRDRIELAVDRALEPVWADHDRLEQVFVNLMDNAVRHGDGTVTVTARCGADGTVLVRVGDQGPGIPAEVAAAMFEARVRSEASHGAGLGLAIARGIMEAHGGSCQLLPGAPTVFEVVLPVEPSDADREAADLAWAEPDRPDEPATEGVARG